MVPEVWLLHAQHFITGPYSVPVEFNPHRLTVSVTPVSYRPSSFHTQLLVTSALILRSSLGNILHIPISNIPIRITYITSLILYHLCVSSSNFLYVQSPFFIGLNIPSIHFSDILSSCAFCKIKNSKNGIVSLIDHVCFFPKYIVHKPSLDTNTYEHSRCFSFSCKCLVCDGKCYTPGGRYLYNLFVTRW